MIKRGDENTGLSVEHKSRDYGRNEEKDREKSRMAETELEYCGLQKFLENK